MTPENVTTIQEQEPRAKVLYTAHGYYHDPLNLEGARGVLNAFGNHLKIPVGRKVLYWEQTDMSPRDTQIIESRIRVNGFKKVFLNQFLYEKLGRVPEKQEIKDVIYRVEHTTQRNTKKMLELGLSPDFIHQYILLDGLDQLKARHNFNVVLEAHKEDVLKKDRELFPQATKLESEATNLWYLGDFNGSLGKIKSLFYSMFQLDLSRERDMARQLQNIIASLLSEKNGGSLFVLTGAAHSKALMKLVHDKFGDKSSISYKGNTGVGQGLHERIEDSLRSGRVVSDEIYMQTLIGILIQDQLQNACIERGKTFDFIENYEKCISAIYRVASGVSLKEGRELCKKRVNLLNFFQLREPSLELNH